MLCWKEHRYSTGSVVRDLKSVDHEGASGTDAAPLGVQAESATNGNTNLSKSELHSPQHSASLLHTLSSS